METAKTVEVIRYDGTRLMTEPDVDNEFLGHCVLLNTDGFPNESKGYLIASAKGGREAYGAILDLKRNEFNGKGLIVTGSDMRGETILGIYSDN